MAKRDRLSDEAKNSVSDKSFAERNWKERLAYLAKPLRAGLGVLANQSAKNTMLGGFVSNKDLQPPKLDVSLMRNSQGVPLKDENGKPMLNNAQMSMDKVSFTSSSGKKQDVEGWVLKAQPGNPTIVFFGGSDFDRGDTKVDKKTDEKKTSYQETLKKMAEEAKKQGMGFAVYDYPKGMSEDRARQFCNQVQQHLKDNHGVELNQQAYAGYSQGSFMATHSANINPEAAGLHITSGFSSGRMAQKDGIKDGTGILGKAIEKRQITEVWDNIEQAEGIVANRDQKPDGQRMPISVVYDNQEDFGNANNRHMTPLIQALNGSHNDVAVQVSSGVEHGDMLKSGMHTLSFEQFAKATKTFAGPKPSLNQELVQQPSLKESSPSVSVAPVKVRDSLSLSGSVVSKSLDLSQSEDLSPSQETDPSQLSVKDKVKLFQGEVSAQSHGQGL